MSWTLVDHELTPYSPMEEIERWERTLEAAILEHPDDEGLRIALDDVRSIRQIKERVREG
ncbi:hypothetical protein TDMWS_17500 [Thermodesulfomicrobium sp. WS]|uniref:hypothetical protein n=1 Tax=Thermodesulfomicrobium sp. WS TaxID=3004129 RepID=UPI0024913225|nr:hypothetical protein [Thermodesulfomicrobium sp. WS]BDV01665.1 hypothetical protein TDMWS_17500 [Thermodesulfomicrobium sp. WS]